MKVINILTPKITTTLQEEFPGLPLGGLRMVRSSTETPPTRELRLVLHRNACDHVGLLGDAHWVEVGSGLAFLAWHKNLYQHAQRRNKHP